MKIFKKSHSITLPLMRLAHVWTAFVVFVGAFFDTKTYKTLTK